MKVGDLVRVKQHAWVAGALMDPETSGLVLEVIYPPTPRSKHWVQSPNALVLFTDSTRAITEWVSRSDLEVISESW